MDRVFILLAGGSGSRFGANHPKQLSMLAGKTIIEHSMQNISNYKGIDQIVIVAKHETMSVVESISKRIGDDRFLLVEGGDERFDSTYRGLTASSAEDHSDVLIHDAVRPFLAHSIIDDCWSSLKKYDGIDVVVPSVDTVVYVGKNKKAVKNIPDRGRFYRGQTPQGFKFGQIKHAHDLIREKRNFDFTDDCGVFKWAFPKSKIGIVLGNEENMKITYPRDLVLAEQIIKSGIGTSEALGVRTHKPINKMNAIVFGGSSGIGEDIVKSLKAQGAKVYSTSRSKGVDVTKIDQVNKYLANVEKECGEIDLIVNSAGILDIGRLPEMDDDIIAASIATNYTGAVLLSKASFPYLKKTAGQLILFSSSSYFRGRKDYSIYSSTKAAIVNFTQAVAEEWVEDNVRVNCIVPRRANTPMRRKAFPDEDPSTLLQPEQVTDAVNELLQQDHSGLVVHVY